MSDTDDILDVGLHANCATLDGYRSVVAERDAQAARVTELETVVKALTAFYDSHPCVDEAGSRHDIACQTQDAARAALAAGQGSGPSAGAQETAPEGVE